MKYDLVTYSFIGREIGWELSDGMAGADRAANQAFAPLETFTDRFATLLDEVVALGFQGLDLWTAHLSWAWVTDTHLTKARAALASRDLRVGAYSGYLGTDAAQFETSCRIAQTIGARVVSGYSPAASAEVAAKYGLRYGFENHGETDLATFLSRSPDGFCVDTGWCATQKIDPIEALRAAGNRLVAVHLKDVRGSCSHETCAFGQGVVPIRECLAVLDEMGFEGPIGIEHFPGRYDPRPEVRECLRFVRGE